MSSALATFFKQVGYGGLRGNSSIVERCPTFNARDKKVFKFKTNKKVWPPWHV
jgi:hypothetical protein